MTAGEVGKSDIQVQDFSALGTPLPLWRPPPRPEGSGLEGTYVALERLEPDRHCHEIHAANQEDIEGKIWDYLPYGPFKSVDHYRNWAREAASVDDPLFFAVRDRRTGLAGGVASYLRIKPDQGSIEVGHINLAPRLQRTRAATEAMFLMMKWAFDAGYRRYEWKCNALNIRSRRAAIRLGLSFEGIFRQATVSKGRNRDTAWFAAIDGEWPTLKCAFETWLSPDNFDTHGRQRQSLAALTAPVLVKLDPVLEDRTRA